MPYLNAEDGVLLYYADEGQGEPILLVHGVSFNHRALARNIPDLSRNHRVVAPDLRGHGYSGKPDFGLTQKQSARDIKTTIDHLGLNNVTLVGWSFGALVVMDYLDRFGEEKLKGVAFVDQSPCPLGEKGWEYGLFGGMLDSGGWIEAQQPIFDDRVSFLQGFVSTCFAGGEVPDEATGESWLSESWLSESMLTPNMTLLASALTVPVSDYRGLMGRLGVPVLLCYGAESVVFPTDVGEYMRERIPNSELVMFEQSGHSPFWEEPEKFNDAVTRFAG